MPQLKKSIKIWSSASSSHRNLLEIGTLHYDQVWRHPTPSSLCVSSRLFVAKSGATCWSARTNGSASRPAAPIARGTYRVVAGLSCARIWVSYCKATSGSTFVARRPDYGVSTFQTRILPGTLGHPWNDKGDSSEYCTRIPLPVRSPKGERNAQLNKSAHSLRQLIAGGELDEPEVLSQLYSAAATAGLDGRETTITIRSGIDYCSAWQRD
jgi:hypothetical protein